MNDLRLRFAGQRRPDLALVAGLHGVARSDDGGLALVEAGDAPLVNFCVDRRGIWLTVGEGAHGVHVNGRPVRRMAMLRAGDAVYVDGTELLLLAPGHDVLDPPLLDNPQESADPRVILRGVGGRHHGRSFTLERPRLVGSASEADIRIEDPAFAERHARLELHETGVVLRDLGSAEGTVVNGEGVRDALLRPGDQLVFDAHHRFVLEAPSRDVVATQADPVFDDLDLGHADAQPRDSLRRSARRLPWLLLAAVLIAAALAALLMFGSSA